MLRVLIVDDEPLGRDRLHDMLVKHHDVEIVGECPDVPSALKALRETSPDLVFLDVAMPDVDGFGLIEAVGARAMPPVVFVTAHDEHALRAFEVDAVDYLQKPFDEDRFLGTLGRARETVADRARRGGDWRPAERLPLRTAGRVSFLKLADIEWVDASHNYVRIHTVDGKTHVAREAIGYLEARLDDARLVRIHRSTIINADRVDELELSARGNYVAIMKSGKRLSWSRSFRHRLPALLGDA